MAIVLGIFVVVVGGAVGIYALTGGFSQKDVDIIKLYMDDNTKSSKEIYTLSDFSAIVNCEPLTATNKQLKVICEDPLSPKDSQGNSIKDGILKNVPKTITAGKAFNIEINKDQKGNNIGGVVTLKFVPADSDKTIADFTLKVIVDVAIPNNSLFFSGNKSDRYNSLTGKTITMGINNAQQYIYLKSDLVNAFFLQANNQNLKKAQISYTYTTLTGELVETKTFDNLQYDYIYNNETQQYNYFYKVPVTPKKSGKIVLSAKMHKTYQIEQDYIAGDFENMQYPTVYTNEHQLKLDKFNEFLNKYIQFFDTSEQSYDFFRTYLTNEGKIRITKEAWNSGAIESAKSFIFQSCSSTINISAVNLKDISSPELIKASKLDTRLDKNQDYFNVFSSVDCTLSDLINKLDLKVRLEEDNESTSIANIDDEKTNLFSTLQVTPYIYIEKTIFSNTYETTWSNYQDILLVTGFESKRPVCEQIGDEAYNDQFMLSSDYMADINASNCKGYLVNLSSQFKDRTYKDYMTVTVGSNAQDRKWNIAFNVPVSNGEIDDITQATKALFLQFKVTGRNLETGNEKVSIAYSRVGIGYQDYVYSKSGVDNIYLEESSIKRMVLNSTINNPKETYATRTQPIDLNLNQSENSIISNYAAASYKSVMYFVEKTSNSLDGSGSGDSKLASIGEYNFKYMNAQFNDEKGVWEDDVYYFGGTKLTGQRIPIFADSNGKYDLRAINASNEPAYIFAVVYLSDANGNPIDVNGRLIKMNDEANGDPTTLYIFKITNVSSSEGMTKVYIDNYVDNMNYYTKTLANITVSQVSEVDGNEVTEAEYHVDAGSFFKRNNVDSYTDSDKGVKFNNETLDKLRSALKLKMLANNRFTLYATNFELNADGTLKTEGENKKATYNIIDAAGITQTKDFGVNVTQNKQLALNELLGLRDRTTGQTEADILSYVKANYSLNLKSTKEDYSPDIKLWMADDGETIIGFVFEIVVEGKSHSEESAVNTGDYIYIKAKTIDGTPTVTNALTTTDAVNWGVSKIEIKDVALNSITGNNTINRFERLTSKYVDSQTSQNTTKTQGFGRVTDNGKKWEPFVLYSFNKESKVVKGSATDNLAYTIQTNLYVPGEFVDTNGLNPDLIDPSQLVYEDGSALEEDPNYNEKRFKDISSYIKYLTEASNSIDIKYHNPLGIVSLGQDMVFKDYQKDGKIHVNDTSFDIRFESDKLIDGKKYNAHIVAEGIEYGVEGNDTNGYYVTLKAGSYFPTTKVVGSQDNTVIIMGQEFKIEDNKISTITTANANRQIIPINTSAIVNGSVYNAGEYIDDSTSSANTALVKTTENQLIEDASGNLVTTACITSATVNFIKGGTVTQNGKYVYVRDDNGKYTFVKNSDGEYEVNGERGNYEIVGSSPENVVVRYSRKGITAYLIVTYTVSGKTINKVLTYELIQEPITLVARSNEQAFEITDSNNSNNLNIVAGQQVEFNLGTINAITKIDTAITYSYAIQVLGSEFESSFFEHCTFTIDSENGGIKFVNDKGEHVKQISKSENSILELFIPDTYNQTTSATITIKYPGIRDNITKVLNLNIVGNYLFKTKDSATNIKFDPDTKNYITTLASNPAGYEISTLMDTYFDYKVEGKNIKLELISADDNTSKLCEITADGKLKIAKSYVKADSNGKPIADQLVFNLKIKDEEKEIDIASKLCITITPDYVIDLRTLENSTGSNIINVLNGQDIFSSDYIRIYAYNANSQLDPVNAEIFKQVCEKLNLKVKTSVDGDYNDCKKGIVNIDKYFETTRILAKVSFNRGKEDSNIATTIDFSLNVIGYDLYFSQDKDFSLQAGQERIDTYESISGDNDKYIETAKPIALNYTLGDKLNLDKYFAVFSNGNSYKTNIYAVLVRTDGTDETYFHDINETTKTNAGVYNLGFAYLSEGKYIKLVTTDVTVNLSYLQLMRDESGNIGSSEYATLDADYAGYKMSSDLTITTNASQIVVKNYIRAFVGGNECSVVVILDGDENNAQLDKVTVGDKATYSVYYIVDGVLINTGYNLVVQKSE